MRIFLLSYCTDDDYPAIEWSSHSPMADLWLEIDECHKAGQDIQELLRQIKYRLELNPAWPQIDCLPMIPGLGISNRAKEVFESLEIPGMYFLEYSVNNDPFFMFYTERCLDCLDRKQSEVQFFESSPDRIKQISRYVFLAERLRRSDIFTIPEHSSEIFFWSQVIFVTEAARSIIERAELAGFTFKELS